MVTSPTPSEGLPVAEAAASSSTGLRIDDEGLSQEMIALGAKMSTTDPADPLKTYVSGLAYDDIHKVWHIEKLKGKSVVLVISGLSNYQKSRLIPYMQGLLMEQEFIIIDTALSDTVLKILEEQAGPQYVDTSENLGQWIPADLIAYVEMPIRALYKSIDGSNGNNYWVSDVVGVKLIDVKQNTVVSSFTLTGLRSEEQMTEAIFINSSVKLIRNSLMD
ncbi:hypothetical protein [Sphaerochaeta sp.]|uniref:hypothetical protein n=1 Tax=Sphaerochaeta sp. TaxID=1972642 RepID=UPI0025885884|nr:hypothetical protein [Sphaerochaeta sp.]MDD3456846.1 hypothetical protein [Sphaerochaeta sp.]